MTEEFNEKCKIAQNDTLGRYDYNEAKKKKILQLKKKLPKRIT